MGRGRAKGGVTVANVPLRSGNPVLSRNAHTAPVLLVMPVSLGSMGCGSGSSSSSSEANKGTYTLTIVGMDTTTSFIAASTTVTLTID